MTDKKHRLLVCSQNANFLNTYRQELDKDFEVQVGASQDICEFLARDWKPQIALIDGDQFGNLTGILRQSFTYSQIGIIVISMNEGIFKEEFAFRSGADHFISQPKDYKSIIWRIISLVRKMQGPNLPSVNSSPNSPEKPASTITIGNVSIYPQDYLVKAHGRIIKITPIQFKLLIALITHSDQLLTREWIKEHIWENANISPRSIDAQISKLKKTIPELGKNIINIYGQGYILTQDGGKYAA